MVEREYAELQRRYGGQYVARIDNHVIANATTYRELSQTLERIAVDQPDLIIEYVDPATSVSVH